MRSNELRVITDKIEYYEYESIDNKTKSNIYSTVKYCKGSIRNRMRSYTGQDGKLNYDTEIILFADTKIKERSKIVHSGKNYEIKLLYREPNNLGSVYFYFLKVL